VSSDLDLEAISRAYAALEADDREALVALVDEAIHPECEWVPFVTGVEGRTYRGRDGMLEFIEDFLGTFSVRYEIETVRPVGASAALVLGSMTLTGRESGVEIPQELGAVFEFEDGLIRRGKASDQATAMAAAEAVA
jgi:ketosteroid isomerase-like protein